MRRLFALAVLILHVLLLALFMVGGHPDMIPELNAPVFVSLWVTPVDPVPPKLTVDTLPQAPVRALPASSRSASPVQVDAPPAPESAPAESTAISVVTPGSESTPAPQVDWARVGNLAARRAAEKLAIVEPTTFSPPPRTVPKPCKPKESSMEWNGQEDRKVTWAGPIPVVKLGKRCVWALVFVACNLSELPETNGHLLDDMRAADRPRSSVPDPNICD